MTGSDGRIPFEAVAEALPQIVWSCDAAGDHDYFSRRWSEFTGIAPEDVTSETWKFLIHPDDQDLVAREWGISLQNGSPYDINYRFRHHSGEYRWLRVMALPIRDPDGRITRWFGTSTDVHDAHLLAAELERLAREDPLTGLLNRKAFFDRAGRLVHQAGEAPVSLLMIDIDHFKAVNDTFGHPVGDRVIEVVAERIRGAIAAADPVGRIGGEEFAVLVQRCDAGGADRLAHRILATIADDPVQTEQGPQVPATVSIGMATATGDAADLTTLISRADRALYAAKAAGRGCARSQAEDRH